MATNKKAMEKLDREWENAKKAEQAIIEFLRVWVAEDETAAEKVLASGKTVRGAYSAMESYARKNSRQGLNGKEAWVQVMKYFGEDETAADQKLEHGLMYACMKAEIEKWRPYGKDVPEITTTPAPEASPSESKAAPAGGFVLSLEDLGL